VLRDFRYALQIIVKERWYSAVAVLALSLGIGLNATVFTLVNAVLLRGLPFKDSGQLYILGSQRQNGNRTNVSLPDLQDWRAQSKSWVGLGAFSNSGTNVSDDSIGAAIGAQRRAVVERLQRARHAAHPRTRLQSRGRSEGRGAGRASRL
jgi:hypothetical protein